MLDNRANIEALLAARVETRVSAGISSGVSSSFPASGIALSGIVFMDETAQYVPSGAIRLEWLSGIVTAAAGGATSLTWYLSMTSSGTVPITDAITSPILFISGSTTTGGCAARIDLPYSAFYDGAGNLLPDGVEGAIYLFVRTNAGSCTLVPRLVWTGFPPYPRDQYKPTL